jgi:RimJ/RimL family protein N-acetyltransferase
MNQEFNHLNQPIGNKIHHWVPPVHPHIEQLDGNYCHLVRLNPGLHARDLFEANTQGPDSRNWTYLSYGPFQSFEDFSSWVDTESRKSDPLFFAIISRETGKAVGVASYLRITPLSGTIEVGHLNFSPLLQRTSAATEAMFLMMAHAFELGYRRYEWKCDALNAPSRATAQRLGFTFEGIFRKATVTKGRNRDTSWYSITDEEWPALRAIFEQWLNPDNFDDVGKQRTSLSSLMSSLHEIQSCTHAQK